MNIVVLGAGNIGTYLTHTLHSHRNTILQVYNRTQSRGEFLAKSVKAEYVNDIMLVNEFADLYIIAVSDGYIVEVAEKLSKRSIKGIVVHTSGATPLSVLHPFLRAGVIYPVQSIHKLVNPSVVPYAIEGNFKDVEELLFNLALTMSPKTFLCNSTQRLSIHVAAVFVNNFSNALYTIANSILTQNGLSLEILMPLLLNTANNAKEIQHGSIQTGPAVRNDIKTIDMHLNFLSNTKELAEIYQHLTNYIIKSKQKEKSN